jgi:hypothetical protein
MAGGLRGATPRRSHGFQSAVVDDFPPLKLHFAEIAKVQTGQWFRI